MTIVSYLCILNKNWLEREFMARKNAQCTSTHFCKTNANIHCVLCEYRETMELEKKEKNLDFICYQKRLIVSSYTEIEEWNKQHDTVLSLAAIQRYAKKLIQLKARECLTCEQSSITSSTTEVLDFMQTRPAINS